MTVNMTKDLRLHNRCTFPRCTGQFNRALVGVSAGGGAKLTGWEFDENEPEDIPAHDHRTIRETYGVTDGA
jgi:hypothetical protein